MTGNAFIDFIFNNFETIWTILFIVGIGTGVFKVIIGIMYGGKFLGTMLKDMDRDEKRERRAKKQPQKKRRR